MESVSELGAIPPSLEAELAKDDSWASLPIRLRQGAEGALEKSLELVSGKSLNSGRRRTLVAALGDVDDHRVVPVLLKLAKGTWWPRSVWITACASV